jgi:hypothetical protein
MLPLRRLSTALRYCAHVQCDCVRVIACTLSQELKIKKMMLAGQTGGLQRSLVCMR